MAKDNTIDDLFLAAALDTVDDGISIIDKDFHILYHNRTIEKRFGDIVGKSCYQAFRGWQEPCGDCLIHKVMEDGKPRKVLRDTQDRNGNIIWMECSVGPVHNTAGERIGAVEIVRNVTENIRLNQENSILKREISKTAAFENIITQSSEMKNTFLLIEKIAPSNSCVLIQGESGTGKELVARAIHNHSDRQSGPFVSVNCGAIPENLLESELFGHAKGAFTGAVHSHDGLIASAESGTLFLDEIGDLPLSTQVKLLRFLQEGTSRKIGETKERKHDVRVVCATNKDLLDSVDTEEFREDLYYRISVIPILLPPLRQRREDIPLLVNHFLHKICEENGRKINGVSGETMKQLMEYSWPGNIRELENAMEYAVLTADNETVLKMENFPDRISRSNSKAPEVFGKIISIEEYAKKVILQLQDEYNEEQIASFLGISRKNLWEKRKRWNLPRNVTAGNGEN